MIIYHAKRSAAQTMWAARRIAANSTHHFLRKGLFMALIPINPKGTDKTSTAMANKKVGEIPSDAIPIPRQEIHGMIYIIKPMQVKI